MNKPIVKLLPHQLQFFRSKVKFTLLCSGIGAGKTFIGCHKIIKKVFEDVGATGLVVANSYKQLNNVVLKTLFSILQELNIDYSYKQTSGYLFINKSMIYCASTEKFDLWRGLEISWFYSDETRDMQKSAWDVLIGRMREKQHKLEAWATTTPAGFNWLYEMFITKKTPDHEIIFAKTSDNPFLPDGYINSLKSVYDEKVIEQELEGRFINITSGRVYYSFDRFKHVKNFEKPKSMPFVGLDFNVDPGCATIGYYENGIFYIWDEIYLRNSNTYQMAEEIKFKYGLCDLIPDSTGASRHSSSSKSDHEILRSYGHRVRYNQNPLVRDRINVCNGLLSHGKLFIHERCIHLIEDLEQLVYDNKNQMLSHQSDSLTYMLWGISPIQRPQTPSRTIKI